MGRVATRLSVQPAIPHVHMDIAEHELVLDIVPSKHWEMDGWILYQPPPIGLADCVSWSHALGLLPADLERAARHHCHARVLIAPHLAPLFQGQARQVFVSLLEQMLLHMR